MDLSKVILPLFCIRTRLLRSKLIVRQTRQHEDITQNFLITLDKRSLFLHTLIKPNVCQNPPDLKLPRKLRKPNEVRYSTQGEAEGHRAAIRGNSTFGEAEGHGAANVGGITCSAKSPREGVRTLRQCILLPLRSSHPLRLNPARTPSSKQGIFPNKANFYSVGGQKNKANSKPNKPNFEPKQSLFEPQSVQICGFDSGRFDSGRSRGAQAATRGARAAICGRTSSSFKWPKPGMDSGSPPSV